MFESILVPLDGSKTAEAVLPYIEAMAANLANEVILVGVSEHDTPELYHSYLKTILEKMQVQVKGLKPGGKVKISSEVLVGDPVTQILNTANRRSVNLIAMTSRGSSGQGSWSLGNVSAKILRASDKPVLLIRGEANQDAIKPKNLLKRILVPLDGSQLGETAIPWASALARTMGAELVLFQAVMTGVLFLYQVAPTYISLDPEKEKAFAMAYLAGVEKSIGDQSLEISRVVAFGAPADGIIDFAEKHELDLIVISTHGRSGIGRWVFGSVTDKVLHSGNTPLLVVRPARTP